MLPRLVLAALIAVMAFAAASSGGPSARAPAGPAQVSDNPLEGVRWYVDKGSAAWKSWRHLTKDGPDP
jgi:hypothetical protein